MNIQEYLSVLNPEQLAAVKHDGSPLLILAGAGSGKTRVITTKIAYLIAECGVSPHEILAVTFTNKAAREMRDRVTLMEPQAAATALRTFHSFGAWFLRMFHDAAGLDPNFTIYDDDDCMTLLSRLVPGLLRVQVKSLLHKISRAKDYSYTPDDPSLDLIDSDPEFRRCYALYQNRLDEIGNLDFGDLILKPLLLLQNDSQVRKIVHQRFRVILVDEYQDSNVAQFKLLQALVGKESYVCVVGDDDQSIYKFRGAEIQNILSFSDSFVGTKIIKLERNYRSVAPILAVASDVVSKNSDRLGKTLIAERTGGVKPALVFLPDQDQESEFVAELIMNAAKKGVPYANWAVLYRTNAQSLTFESIFLRRQIPYQVIGSLKFYEREEIKDALAYLSLVSNPRDEVGFRRVVNKPARGIGNVTQQKIITSAVAAQGDLVKTSADLASSFAKKASAGLKVFTSVIGTLSEMLDAQTDNPSVGTIIAHQRELPESERSEKGSGASGLAEFVSRLIELSGLGEYYRSQDEIAGTQRMANLQELMNNASLYPLSRSGLSQFLEHIELDRTAIATAEDDTPSDAVTLITIHNTKGLEFPRVIITGLELGIFPREDKTGDDIEEERRLMYVGVTRAKDELYLTSCAIRRMYGRTSYMLPSPFLSEIDPQNLDILGSVPRSFSRKADSVGGTGDNGKGDSSSAVTDCGLKKGDDVYNDDYGYGQITAITIDEESGEVTVSASFENGGTKRFLPKYQPSALLKIQKEDYDC